MAYDQIDKAPEERKEGLDDFHLPRRVSDRQEALRAHRLPRATPITSRT